MPTVSYSAIKALCKPGADLKIRLKPLACDGLANWLRKNKRLESSSLLPLESLALASEAAIHRTTGPLSKMKATVMLAVPYRCIPERSDRTPLLSEREPPAAAVSISEELSPCTTRLPDGAPARGLVVRGEFHPQADSSPASPAITADAQDRTPSADSSWEQPLSAPCSPHIASKAS